MLDEQFGVAVVMCRALEALEDLGATLVRSDLRGNLKGMDWRSGVGDEIVLKLYPRELIRHQFEELPTFLLAELKRGLHTYLCDWVVGSSMRTIADVIAFNKANADRALRFGQTIFLAAEQSHPTPDRITHTIERCRILRATYARAITVFMDHHRLDAVLFPGSSGAGLAAKAGFPSVHVPAGMVSGVGSTSTPDYPFGITFTGRAWDEPVLLRLAYAFEQGTKARIMPQSVPPLRRASVP